MKAIKVPVVELADYNLDGESRTVKDRVKPIFNSAIGSISITVIVLFTVGVIWVGNGFLTKSNITIIGTALAVPLLLGTFASVALLAGVVDLSIGANAGLSASIFAYLVLHHFGTWQAAGVVLASCLSVGIINGLVIVYFGANPIAATLGMLTVLSGLQYVVTGTVGGLTALIPGLYNFANRDAGPFLLVLVIIVGMVVIAVVLVSRTRIGRHVRAVGGDQRAAERAGIGFKRIRYGALLLSALGAGLGGLLYIGQLGGVTDTLGTDVVFEVYAGLMIGGYSIIRGGVGNPAGGALGMLVIAGVTDIIDLKSVNTYYTDVVVGVLLLAAVLLDRIRGGDSYE